MPDSKKSNKSPVLQKCSIGHLKKHKRVRQSEKVIKDGKNIRVDDEGVEDFDDYFTKSNVETDPSATNNISVELNTNNLKTSLPCKHHSMRKPIKSDDSNISEKFGNHNSIIKPNSSDYIIKNSNSGFKKTPIVLRKIKSSINKKHRRKRKDEKEVKQGKIIRTDEDGIEEFDDYFTKSTILDLVNSSESRDILKRSKSPKNIVHSKKTEALRCGQVGTSMHNGLPSPINKKNEKMPSTNHALNGTTKKSSANDKNKVIEGPNSLNKKAIKRKPELKKCEVPNQKNEWCLAQSNPGSPIAKFNGVVETSKSVYRNSLSEFNNSDNSAIGLSNKNATSPCRVTVVDLSHSQSFVSRVESCKVDLFTNCSPGKRKKAHSNSQCKENQTFIPETKTQNLKQIEDKSEWKSRESKNCPVLEIKNIEHDKLVNVIKHCSNVRLEIENLSPKKINKISNTPEKIARTTSKREKETTADKSKVSRVLSLNETKEYGLESAEARNDSDSSISTRTNEQACESGSQSDKPLRVGNKKLRNAKGGKHFLPKRNFVRERRSSTGGQKYFSEESDSDDASESDGHIYIPSKPSKPQIKRVSTGDPEDLAIPSTSRWKPKIKRSKKVKPNKVRTPEVRKKLSTIMESNDKMINASLWNSPDFQPKVLLTKLEIRSTTINNHGSMELDKQRLKSALKGTRKKNPRLSVSFQEQEKFTYDRNSIKLKFGENFLPLCTPSIRTPNVRRSKRKKIPRLNYGLNQKVVYQKRPSGGFSAVGIDLGCTPEKPGQTRHYQRRLKNENSRIQSLDSSLSRHQSSMIAQEFNTTLPLVIDPITHQEVTYELYSKQKTLTWFGPTSLHAEAQDPFVTAKPLQDSLAFFGFLKLRGNCQKPFSQRPNNSLTFIITKGKVLVEIHNFQMVMEKGDAFVIPKGNSYKLTNLRDDEATLIFINK